MTTDSFLQTLKSRGLLYQYTEGLAAHLAGGARTVYCGFDPTAPSLHVGNLVPVMVLLRLAAAGHRVIALVGGGTAMIGDPSGKSAERPLLSAEDVATNSAAIEAQLRRIAGHRIAQMGQNAPFAVTLKDNAEWLRGLGAIEFLRDVGKHFPVNQMLAKDTVKSRLETGISFTEFSYMLLQAYDFLQLFTRHEVTIQVGGSDQWGNLTAGTELIRRAAGGEAHALTTPLLTTASGRKFGKTEAGAVWLDGSKTTVFDFYQYWLNAEDADVLPFLRLFTQQSDDELAAAEQSLAAEPQKRNAHRILAREMTALVHGPQLAETAAAASALLFTRDADYNTYADDVFELLNAAAGRTKISVGSAAHDVGVADVATSAFQISKSEVRRLLDQGGLSVNGTRLAQGTAKIALADAIRGRWFVLKRGSQKVAVAEVVRTQNG